MKRVGQGIHDYTINQSPASWRGERKQPHETEASLCVHCRAGPSWRTRPCGGQYGAISVKKERRLNRKQTTK